VSALTLHDFPALGFVPCPGDQIQAESVAQVVQLAAKALEEVDHALRGAADGDWRGEAARAFREMLAHDFRPKMENAQRSFSEAATTLTGWASYMKTQQAQAAKLEAEAQQYAATLSSSNAHLNSLPASSKPGDPQPQDTAAQAKAQQDAQDRAKATTAVNNAQSALDDIRNRAHRLHDDYEGEGRRAAAKLKHAVDEAPTKPGWFQSMADSIGSCLDDLGKWVGEIGDKLVPLLAKIAPLLQFIGDVAGLLSTIAGLLAFIPGLQFLAVPALILGGIALLCHYGAAVGESGSFLSALTNPNVIMDAVGLAFGLGALKAGVELTQIARTAEGSDEAMSGFKVALKSMNPRSDLPSVPSYKELAFPKDGEKPYDMSFPEFGWRAVQFHSTWGGNVMTAMGYRGSISLAKDLLNGKQPGQLINNSPIAATS
jgi:hypothetical protein